MLLKAAETVLEAIRIEELEPALNLCREDCVNDLKAAVAKENETVEYRKQGMREPDAIHACRLFLEVHKDEAGTITRMNAIAMAEQAIANYDKEFKNAM